MTARLFGVKLSFPIEIELAGWCQQYGSTEHALRVEFGQNRLEGEWFAFILNQRPWFTARVRGACKPAGPTHPREAARCVSKPRSERTSKS